MKLTNYFYWLLFLIALTALCQCRVIPAKTTEQIFTPKATEKSTKFLIGISPGNIRLTDQQLEKITQPDKKNGNVHFTHVIRDTWLNVRARRVPKEASPTQQWEPLFSFEQLVIAREAVKHAEKGSTKFYLGLEEYFTSILLNGPNEKMNEETISGYVDQLIAFARVAGYEGINLTLRSNYTLLKTPDQKERRDRSKRREDENTRRLFVLQRLVKFAEIVKAEHFNTASLSTTDSEPVKGDSSPKENAPLKFSFTMNSRSNLWNEDTISLMNKAIDLAEFVIVLDPLELKLDQQSHPSTDRFKMREWRAGEKAFSKPIIDSFFKTIIKKLKADKNKLILYSSIAVLMEQTVKEKKKFWSTTMSDYCKILSSQRKNGKNFTFQKLPTTKSIKDLSPFTVEIKKVTYKVHYNSQKKAELVDEYRGIAINMEQDRACAGMEPFPNLTFFSRLFEKEKVRKQL